MPGVPLVFIVPAAVLLLAHVPPVIDGVREVVDPAHTAAVPDTVGLLFTLTVVITEQLPIA